MGLLLTADIRGASPTRKVRRQVLPPTRAPARLSQHGYRQIRRLARR